ncbi:MAG: hypothetical protein IT257_04070, partial [Chitinophagaceae bacterium]|nr:hypothetical protein [Chitinophagaceae bacterium]
MSNKTLRVIFILSVLSTILMIAIQFFLIKKAYKKEKDIFNAQVTSALREVAVIVLQKNNNYSQVDSIISRVDEDYYTVRINDKIDTTVLENLVKREFNSQNIKTDFEILVYDCESDDVVFRKYINLNKSETDEEVISKKFPKNLKHNNYFAIHFPNLDRLLTNEMIGWGLSSLVLFLFLLTLAYVIFSIFRQKRLS